MGRVAERGRSTLTILCSRDPSTTRLEAALPFQGSWAKTIVFIDAAGHVIFAPRIARAILERCLRIMDPSNMLRDPGLFSNQQGRHPVLR